ncbi:hypothetical protein [Paraburkholderia sp. GAS199]|uniref:hypothetical protein n=1 Tax=Paraburkholderia sp. GAS199 TaxID=3035126 RepID=UPI003D20C35D
MAARLPHDAARDKFERLWDETNALAAKTVHTFDGQPYLSLLKRMHQTFESRYSNGAFMNGHGKRRS